MQKIAVMGGGSWGTALAILLAKKKHPVGLWVRNEQASLVMERERSNPQYLPGATLPANVSVSHHLEDVLSGAGAVILAVPSHAVRSVISQVAPYIDQDTLVINTAKGLELGSLQRLSQVIIQELQKIRNPQVAVLSGPSHAEEVVKDMPTAVVVAATSKSYAESAQDLLMTPHFRVYTNPDMIGVELGGALKNIIALATGISDGLGFGDNTRAALITRGIAEIGRLGVALGASPFTFAGLAGIGDLVVTCNSMHSRNRRAGILLGQGMPLERVLAKIGMVVEGIRAVQAGIMLGEQLNIEMPITREIHQILFKGQNPAEGVSNLMQRTRTHEVEDVSGRGRGW